MTEVPAGSGRGQTLVDIRLQHLTGWGVEESQRPLPYAAPDERVTPSRVPPFVQVYA
jgi:hypothetical protein